MAVDVLADAGALELGPEGVLRSVDDDEVGRQLVLRQQPPQARCVAAAAAVQRPVEVGQVAVVPTGLGVAQEQQGFH